MRLICDPTGSISIYVQKEVYSLLSEQNTLLPRKQDDLDPLSLSNRHTLTHLCFHDYDLHSLLIIHNQSNHNSGFILRPSLHPKMY